MYPQCIVLEHYKNLGKGRALKTAFNYYMIHLSDLKGIVTVDADNQHHIDDIIKCSEALLSHQDKLILGARDFYQDNVPKSNRAGNLITAWVFRVLCGIRITDTQTGLRAMSTELVSQFLDLSGERFEYETNMLIEAKKKMIPIEEIRIKTVYIGGNRTSHFNPFRDSVKIYLLIVKFLSASIISCLVDLGAFTVLTAILSSQGLKTQIFTATVVARILSSLINYSMNRGFVFQAANTASNSFRKYFTLAAVQMLLSMSGVYLLTSWLGIHSTAIKVVVDFILFFISFQIQREWVFARTKNPKQSPAPGTEVK
jgi:dolichol-phosphate mannosyltransferase